MASSSSQATYCPDLGSNFYINSFDASAFLIGIKDPETGEGRADLAPTGMLLGLDPNSRLMVTDPSANDTELGAYFYLDYTSNQDASNGGYQVQVGSVTMVEIMVEARVADWLTCYLDPTTGDANCDAGGLRTLYACPCSSCGDAATGVFLGEAETLPADGCTELDDLAGSCDNVFGTVGSPGSGGWDRTHNNNDNGAPVKRRSLF